MAENKKSFVLYADQKTIFEELTNEEAGALIKHIFKYVNDEDPETDDRIVKIAFEPVKQQLKRDLQKWRGEIEKKSESGKNGNLKRWHPDLFDRVVKGEITEKQAWGIAKDRIPIAPDRTLSDTDRTRSHPIANIADTVTVTDTVINPPISPTGGLTDDEPEMKVGFVVPDMCRLWYKKFPHYTQDLKKDQHAMGQIIAFIEKNEAGREGGVREIVEKIAEEIEKDRFWVNKALSSIANKIQEFYNKIKNPHAERTTPKDRNGGFGILAEDLAEGMAALAARKQRGP